MTEAAIIAIIQAAIVANGNNEITANVMRPVLVSMSEQINGLVGALNDLDTVDKTSIVNAINEIINTSSGGVVIRTGTADPNITPPPTVNQGDFYNRTSGGSTISYYVYTGIDFVLLANNSTNSNSIVTVSSPSTVGLSVNTVVYNGSNLNDLITIPTASTSLFREITIVNQSSVTIKTNPKYTDFTGNNSEDEIVLNSSITIKSNGTNWIRKI